MFILFLQMNVFALLLHIEDGPTGGWFERGMRERGIQVDVWVSRLYTW